MNIERAKYLKHEADQLKKSFDRIKIDPMNLNLLMEHIAKLSTSVDELLRNVAELYEQD